MALSFSREKTLKHFYLKHPQKIPDASQPSFFCIVNPFFPKYVHCLSNLKEELLISNEFPV